ncbi:ATP-dependent DNA helicase RecG [Pusillimonas sp. CC-YST705]|uniref:ATP-dependent DNA helicase RecG n=1 Tax=Mesopusillimonas faecipullorum TaxID=2755040 RepID=A0ABS8CAM7_9BURK|nr:ATP-dependent DNA helicase RecG [Mesopusillimonas faecipullorum]MCB5363065.1 ATP-dependent DNA helicase RecG [Mesopusillimonas faecipullorum]
MPSQAESAPRNKLTPLQQRLQRLGLQHEQDFIVHLPLRYEDQTQVTPIARLRPGQASLVEAEVLQADVQFRPRRQLQARVADDSGELALRWLNFYPSQQKALEVGRRLRIWGEARLGFNGLEMVHPRLNQASGMLSSTLTPIYPTTAGLAQPSLRRLITQALARADLSDTLPDEVRRRFDLIPFEQAIRCLHHPSPDVSLASFEDHSHPAWHRIKFDELLAQQLSLAMARAMRHSQKAWPLDGHDGDLVQRLEQAIPFALTGAQQRAVAEIRADMLRAHPMHRLLQGDVGSGKTVVAAMAAAIAIDSGFQVALMAPTEILAEQHFRKLADWLGPLGVQTTWLTGSLRTRQRREALESIANGNARLVVGTQALIQTHVQFEKLGLVVLDEQHRFGVGQRLELNRKGEEAEAAVRYMPHQLSMSATPIPRTLAMTFFADLDVSVLDELPPGRSPVVTKLISMDRRDEVLAHVGDEIRQGRQAYWVCPLVEESEALQLQTAVDTHALLAQAMPDLSIGLVHGRLKPDEKAAVMEAFRQGEIHLLVATTVIEVGVDVPNASLMLIEHAERFGLAQLHQLRGRVGRGSAKSVCLLMYQTPLSMVARQRLRAMYETNDGFEIARRDLEQRGPGEFLGVRQSGQALLRFADLETDGGLVEQARTLAAEWLEQQPELAQRHLRRWMRGRQDYLRS